MSKLLFDFADPRAAAAWHPIDDRVMGGVSGSRLRHDPQGHAVFEATVSLERGGGFASVRSDPGALRLPHAQTCEIALCGNSRQFKLSLLTGNALDSVNDQAAITTAGNAWQTLRLPLAAFRASFRGREVREAPALDPARIRQGDLAIAAGQAGPFALAIRRIGLD
jgi:NADH dehydrogenase [ubiquinone] 1 alpha subcomplex assembly factor 1